MKQFQPSKTQNQNHENPILQKFDDMYTQVFAFFSASDIMEAVRGRFHFYGMKFILGSYYEPSMNAMYPLSCSGQTLTRHSIHPTVPVLLTKRRANLLWHSNLLQGGSIED